MLLYLKNLVLYCCNQYGIEVPILIKIKYNFILTIVVSHNFEKIGVFKSELPSDSIFILNCPNSKSKERNVIDNKDLKRMIDDYNDKRNNTDDNIDNLIDYIDTMNSQGSKKKISYILYCKTLKIMGI